MAAVKLDGQGRAPPRSPCCRAWTAWSRRRTGSDHPRLQPGAARRDLGGRSTLGPRVHRPGGGRALQSGGAVDGRLRLRRRVRADLPGRAGAPRAPPAPRSTRAVLVRVASRAGRPFGLIAVFGAGSATTSGPRAASSRAWASCTSPSPDLHASRRARGRGSRACRPTSSSTAAGTSTAFFERTPRRPAAPPQHAASPCAAAGSSARRCCSSRSGTRRSCTPTTGSMPAGRPGRCGHRPRHCVAVHRRRPAPQPRRRW